MDLLGLFARRGESYLHPHGRAATDALLEALASYSPRTILELGCGTGATLVETSLRFPRARIVGLDYRLDMLAQAQRRLQATGIDSVSLVKSRVGQLPISARWAAIYCESVLAILTPREWQQAAQQAFQMLEPGGVLVANEAVWAPEVSASQAKELNREMYRRYRLIQAVEKPLNAVEWIAAFRAIGFRVETAPLSLPAAHLQRPRSDSEIEETLSKSLCFSKEQARQSRRTLDLLRSIALRWYEWITRHRRLPLDSRLFVLQKP